MSIATIGVTGSISYETGSTWNVVPGVTRIDIPSGEVSEIDLTNLAITNNYKTNMGGMIDPGNVGFDCQYTAALYNTLDGLRGVTSHWKVESPTAEAEHYTFDGWIKDIKGEYQANALVMLKVEIRVTGIITAGAGS